MSATDIATLGLQALLLGSVLALGLYCWRNPR